MASRKLAPKGGENTGIVVCSGGTPESQNEAFRASTRGVGNESTCSKSVGGEWGKMVAYFFQAGCCGDINIGDFIPGVVSIGGFGNAP